MSIFSPINSKPMHHPYLVIKSVPTGCFNIWGQYVPKLKCNTVKSFNKSRLLIFSFWILLRLSLQVDSHWRSTLINLSKVLDGVKGQFPSIYLYASPLRLSNLVTLAVNY